MAGRDHDTEKRRTTKQKSELGAMDATAVRMQGPSSLALQPSRERAEGDGARAGNSTVAGQRKLEPGGARTAGAELHGRQRKTRRGVHSWARRAGGQTLREPDPAPEELRTHREEGWRPGAARLGASSGEQGGL
jgi:hypothetical protein